LKNRELFGPEMKTPRDINEYIADFPPAVQKTLQALRQTIRKAAPAAEESISYQIPTFVLCGSSLVHFAAFKNHIGFYPRKATMAKFKKKLSRYEQFKGTIRFPLDKPLPLGLITRIVKFRVKENLERAKSRK
jgi:uncharacterized protein YdhG (YjbR/CyaY superfamily)